MHDAIAASDISLSVKCILNRALMGDSQGVCGTFQVQFLCMTSVLLPLPHPFFVSTK